MLVLLLVAAGLAAVVGFSSGASTGATFAADPASGAEREREIPAMRTRTSKTFQQADGSYLTKAFLQSVNYRAADGSWRPIDTSVKKDGAAFRNGPNAFDVSIPERLPGDVRLVDGDRSLSFALRNADAAGTASGDRVTFADARPGVELSYTSEPDGVKELLRLDDANATSSFVFDVALSAGLTLTASADGGLVASDDQGKAAFHVAAPVMWDSASPRSESHALTYELEREGEGWVVRLDAAGEWLASEERVWPVTVDPTATVNPTVDTYMSSSQTTTSFNTSTQLLVGLHGTSSVNRALLNFDLSAIRADALVLSADLALYGASASTGSVDVHKVTSSWTSAATWNQRSSGTAWSTAGGEFASTVEDNNTSAGGTTGWSHWYPTELAQKWVDGSVTNYGLLLKATGETTATNLAFQSAENTNKPTLSVEWNKRTGLDPRWTYDSFQLSDRSTLRVNVASGDMVLHERDLTLAGTGPDLTVDRWFNSGSSKDGSTGSWWSLGTSRDIYMSERDSGKTVIFNGPQGTTWRFKKNSDGSYTSPPAINATLIKDASDSNHFKLTYQRSREVMRFRTDGILKSHEDKNGHKITFTYPASSPGRTPPGTITDSRGRSVSFPSPNNEGRITSMTDPAGRTWGYSYSSFGGDASKLLTTYTNPVGQTTQYEYGSSSSIDLVKITDGRGNITKLEYDSSHRVTKVIRVTDATAGTGPTTTYSYDLANRKTTVTDPRGNSTTGSTTDGQTVYTWDRNGQVSKVVDAKGRTRDTTYTPNGDADSIADNPGGTGNTATTTLTYNTGSNTPSTSTGAEGEAGSNSYWSSATRSGDSFPGYEQYLPRSATNAQSNGTYLGYDSAGNVTDVKDNETSPANKATLAYTNPTDDPSEPKGLLKSATDGESHTTAYAYNTIGELTTVTPPASTIGTTTFTYDAASRVATVTDGKSQVATNCYDQLDRVKRTYWSNGNFTEYDYDANGNQTARRSGTGASSCTNGTTSETTSYVYDKLNRRTSETFPDAKTNTYTYDVNSQLETLTDQGGTVTYSYDEVDRVSLMTFPSTTSSTSALATIDIDYDDQGRKRTVIYPAADNTATGARVVTITDRSGKTKSIEAQDSTTSHAMLRKLEYTYRRGTASADTLLRNTESVNSGATVTTYAYDNLDRLCWSSESTATSFGCSSAPTGTSTRAYTFDNASNRRTKKVGSTTTTYGYNAANQLCWRTDATTSNTGCTAPTGATTYAYDLNGNQTTISGTTTFGYDIRDRLTTVGTSALGYISPTNGELSSIAGTDYYNNLLGLGRRSGSSSTYYLRDPAGQFLLERKSTGNYAIVPDALGSTRWLLQGDSVVRSYTYDPDGASTASGSGPDTEIRFAGGHRVSTGGAPELYHFGRRYYDPQIARWTQADPLDQPRDLRQANRYQYAGTDPVNMVDPDGLHSTNYESFNGFLGEVGYGCAENAAYGAAGGAAIGAFGGPMGLAAGALSGAGAGCVDGAAAEVVGEFYGEGVEDVLSFSGYVKDGADLVRKIF